MISRSPNFLASAALTNDSKKNHIWMPLPDFDNSIYGISFNSSQTFLIAHVSSIKLFLSKSITKNFAIVWFITA